MDGESRVRVTGKEIGELHKKPAKIQITRHEMRQDIS